MPIHPPSDAAPRAPASCRNGRAWRRLKSLTIAWVAIASAASVMAAPSDSEPLVDSASQAAAVRTPNPIRGVDTAASTRLLDKVRVRASEMVVTALNFVGVAYSRGGTSQEAGFDCSGFTRFVFNSNLGLLLPRRADEQAGAAGLVEVAREDLQPGDLVFFNTLQRTFSHVGIYIGDNRFVHAPRPGREVRIEDMGYAYWKSRFSGARRAEMALAHAAVVELPVAAVSAR